MSRFFTKTLFITLEFFEVGLISCVVCIDKVIKRVVMPSDIFIIGAGIGFVKTGNVRVDNKADCS